MINESFSNLTLLEASQHICHLGLKGIPTYMLPKVKGYTDIYVTLTYTGTETRVVWVIYTRNPLFRARVKFFLTSKRVNLRAVAQAQ